MSATPDQSFSNSSLNRLPARFDHERLEVYHLELQLESWVTRLLVETKPPAGVKLSDYRVEV